MAYPEIPDYNKLGELITLYAQLKHEYGAKNISPILARTETALKSVLEELKTLSIDSELAKREPNDLHEIRQLRPGGPRRLWDRFCPTTYRFIGEMNATGKRRGFARLGGDFFPVGTDRRGRRVGALASRFPKTSWRQLNILTSLLEAGQEGPVATARFEMLR